MGSLDLSTSLRTYKSNSNFIIANILKSMANLSRTQRNSKNNSRKSVDYLCPREMNKVDLLLNDLRKNPDEALQLTDYLKKRRNALIKPFTNEEKNNLKTFLVSLNLVNSIDLQVFILLPTHRI